MRAKSTKDKLKILLFTAPALIIYILFLLIPILASAFFSLSEWSGIKGAPINFVGFKNYIELFKDSYFHVSMKNLLSMVFFSVLFHTPIALLLAVAIHSKVKGHRFFKSVYFLPTLFPLTATGLLWYFIFMPDGFFNEFLELIGLSSLATDWLVNAKTAMPTIIFVNIWAGIGYFMVILLAGLTTIPEEIYEAARIDGAGPVRTFFTITVPLLKPIITLCITLDIINTVKIFDLIFVMTEGGPNGLTNLPTTLLYNEAFRYGNFGIGSALGVIILIIALILTVFSSLLTRDKEEN